MSLVAHRVGKLTGSLCMTRSLLTDQMLSSSMASQQTPLQGISLWDHKRRLQACAGAESDLR